MRKRALFTAIFLSAAAFSAAYMQTFEGFDALIDPYTSISTSGEPTDFDAHIEGGLGFYILDLTGIGAPTGWHHRSILLDISGSNAMVFNFHNALPSVSIQLGDYGNDLDHLYLEAYSGVDGTGTLLATDHQVYGVDRSLGDGDFATLSAAASGIRSIRVYGQGLGGGSSIYLDNLVMAPEPGTVLLGITAVALARKRIMKRRTRPFSP